MLGFVALLKREEKTTDISFQVSTPLNNQQETDSYSNKGKSFHWGKQGSQAANPISQHSKNENAYNAASLESDRAQLLTNNRATAVQLSAFTSSLRGKRIQECRNQLTHCTKAHNTVRGEVFWEILGIHLSYW